MAIGKMKKIIPAMLLSAIVAFSAAASACAVKSAHPRARITVEFNSKEYTVDYKLYRNMYPNTVQHFIELADSGFYNGTVIHDYSAGEWYAGGYGYDAEAYATAISGDGNTVREYFEHNSKEADYYSLFADGKLTPTVYYNTDYKLDKNGKVVYEDENGKTVGADTSGASPVRVINGGYALPTVMGEFYENINQEIKNGALSADVGCLKMFYYFSETEGSEKNSKIYVTPTSDQIIMADYKNNCATSLFTMQVGSSNNPESKYCVFGTVLDQDDLTELSEAVQKYFEETYGSSSSTLSADGVNITLKQPSGGKVSDRQIEETFRAPKTAIIIKNVKITKH